MRYRAVKDDTKYEGKQNLLNSHSHTYVCAHSTCTHTYARTHVHTHLKDTHSRVILIVETTIEQIVATVLIKYEIQKLLAKERHLHKKKYTDEHIYTTT